MTRPLVLLFVGLLITGGIGATAVIEIDSESRILVETITFSEPYIKENDEYIDVSLNETTSYLMEAGNPVLPVYVKIFTFPFGTIIKDLTCTFSCSKQKVLSGDISPARRSISTTYSASETICSKQMKNEEIYSSGNIYPETNFLYQIGSGLDGNEHVTFVTIRYYPILYSPLNKTIYYTPQAEIVITYEPVRNQITFPDEYGIAVIAPSKFEQALCPYVQHKNSVGINTTFKSIEGIYAEYPGRDEAEKIKYFIKDAIEIMGISYVLLVGNIDDVPIRLSYTSSWFTNTDVITDFYYSDIYDSNGNFSSWDANNNGKFGETNKDQVDMFPDVHVGRLACDNTKEVDTVVDKIIHYETGTFGKDWFNRIILMGGNTLKGPHNPGKEGESINSIIWSIMSDFQSTIIWTSKGNFNKRTINNAINLGAGFLDYSGHGFEYGIGTYTPSELFFVSYYAPYIKNLNNEYKLPIMFFDACLTAKLDFILNDLLDYKAFQIFRTLTLLLGIDENKRLPCFAWNFVKHEGGGAIATIGATRLVDTGIVSGGGKMSIEFFEAYDSCETLGQMMTKAQITYMSDVPRDSFTVEEFILLGDPSLKMGGYP